MFPNLVLILLTAAQSGAPDGTQRETATTVRRAVHTPDEIAPAILPYLACLYASRGSPLLDGTAGRQIIPDGITTGSDCAAYRDRAERDAVRLLVARPNAGASEPSSIVAKALADIDSYVASLPAPRSAPRPSGLPEVSGLPVTMEDEVQPAYEKYHSCLTAKVRGIPMTAATALTAFKQAMASCNLRREQLLEEAAVALIAKGWDESARKAAAEQTFSQADKAWQTMGRRLHEALLRQASEGPPAKQQPRN